MTIWNPWHGCRKFSPGCRNCYVYRRDAEFGKDSSIVKKTKQFDLPLKKDRHGDYKLQDDGEYVYCCMTSDFFIEEADAWRPEIWDIIRARQDLTFSIITKRIHRFRVGLPDDWGDGWDHVHICVTCEDQSAANDRLPILLDLPLKHRSVIHEPMLGRIDIETALASGKIESVTCGGESGEGARECDFAWILFSMEQCVRRGVRFHFKQTGANFRKGDRVYHIDRKDQMIQAAKAGVDYLPY
ncbi:MAG: DUF5131 family protein [Lachnospiraceae bacterium]|nr:DUF5131 family protein [Lachnospiraceae bacterium]